MTRRKQNCPKRMKWEGGEGEEPPEGIQEDEDGDEEDDDVSRHSSESTEMNPDSVIPSPITVLQENCNTHPVDFAHSNVAPAHTNEDTTNKELPAVRAAAATTPPPPVLQRCSSDESLASESDENVPSMYQPVPPRLATMVPASSPLISSSSSPPLLLPVTAATPPLKSPALVDCNEHNAVLDFSRKKRTEENVSPVLNLSRSAPGSGDATPFVGNGPLDLSVGSTKKRELEDPQIQNAYKKPARMAPASPWTSPLLTYQLPYFQHMSKSGAGGANIPSLDPALWNGKVKMSDKGHFGFPMASNDAAKALEKMNELSKLGVGDEYSPSIPLSPSVGSSSGRHNAWQSHWLNKGAEQAKDVLKCVWCKQSFPSLAAMTTHMQEAKHCGVNVPIQPMTAAPTPSSQTTTTTATVSSVSSSSAGSAKSSPADLNLLIKETMPLPRKLVRGQDVWLGKGAEQTRQILKCMWCGQSFRTLAEMTSHMQQTQHYTNIISQEQIISWKSSEDGKSGSGSNFNSQSGLSSNVNSSSANSHVSAVLTCKVCDQAFSSLKDLSTHMMKNSHYKEHIMRSLTESGGRRRQTREKRKKSLPVRKLLELERAQNELKNGVGDNMMMTLMMMGKSNVHSSSSSRIPCEKCGDKIDVSMIVEHIRMCVGNISDEKKNLLKNALMSTYNNAAEPFSESTGASKSSKDSLPSSFHQRLSPKVSETSKDSGSKSDTKSPSSSTSSSPSVLNAIEKLIEKSFDPRSRHAVTGYSSQPPGASTSPIGSSILKRLGIDESVDYTKPLMEVNLQAARAFALGSQYHNSANYDPNYFASGRRERSGSESSSVSERGSSRHESSTPDRKIDEQTPRTTPEKRISTPPIVPKTEPKDEDARSETKDTDGSLAGDEEMKDVKEEPSDADREERDKVEPKERRSSSELSRSCTPMEENVGEDLSSGRRCRESPIAASPTSKSITGRESASPRTNFSASPTNSERSITPRSTSDKKSSGSLGALSSMFDSLSGTNTSSASLEAPAQSNKTSNHPLAALQKLCDKTETHHHAGNGSGTRSTSSASGANHLAGSSSSQSNMAGAILAFSWACNDGVVTESLMKCAFCDTVLNSKGMYRHHLSKAHFVKDGMIPEPVPLKSPTSSSAVPAAAAAAVATTAQNSSLPISLVKNSSAPAESNCKVGGSVSVSSSCSSIKSPPSQNTFDDPHTKFLKYSELAKQLSSKY